MVVVACTRIGIMPERLSNYSLCLTERRTELGQTQGLEGYKSP